MNEKFSVEGEKVKSHVHTTLLKDSNNIEYIDLQLGFGFAFQGVPEFHICRMHERNGR